MMSPCGTCKSNGRVNKGRELCSPCNGLGYSRTEELSMPPTPADMKQKADRALASLFALLDIK